MIGHKLTPRWKGTAETGRRKDLILELLGKGMSLYGACLDARISHNMVYVWRKTDRAFRAACSKAIQVSAELRAQERNRLKDERQAAQERRMAMWRPVNRIAP
jgi:terminase small subunit-like protein